MANIIFLLSILSKVACQGTFYVSKNMSNWASDGIECVPATPNVEAAVGNYPNVYDIHNLKIDIPDNEDVWVGYYQVVRAFEYIGCVVYSSFFNTRPSFVKIKGDPGHCFPGCGESTNIGVTKTRCYCLGDLNLTMLTEYTQGGCTDKCDNPSVACGQDRPLAHYSYISIYTINPQITESSISTSLRLPALMTKDCLMLAPEVPKSFWWEHCSVSRRVMCLSDNRVMTERSVGVPECCSWINASNTCLQKGRFPTLYSNSKYVNSDANPPLWTGIFKIYVTYKHNAAVPVDRRYDKKYFGFLTKETETSYKLRFAETDSEKRVLCVQDRNRIKFPTTRVIRKTTKLPSVPTKITNLLSTENTDKNKQTLKIKQESSSGLSVTVPITTAVISAFVAAFIAVALTVFLMKKRRTNQRSILTEVGYVPEQPLDITPISEEARGGADKTIQDNRTRGDVEEMGIQNPQNNAYESLGERNDSEHGYGTSNARSIAYESLGERHEEEHRYGISVQAASGFYQTLEGERIDPHIYEIAERPRELAYDSIHEIKDTHYDETSNQTTSAKPYEWVQ